MHMYERRVYELQEPSSTFYSAQTKQTLLNRLDKMTADVQKVLSRQGFEGTRLHVERMLNMRFEGTDTALMVLPDEKDGDGKEDFEAAFKRVYKAEFGFLLDTKSIIVDDLKVSYSLSSPRTGTMLTMAIRTGSRNRKDLRHSRRIRLCRSRQANHAPCGSGQSRHEIQRVL